MRSDQELLRVEQQYFKRIREVPLVVPFVSGDSRRIVRIVEWVSDAKLVATHVIVVVLVNRCFKERVRQTPAKEHLVWIPGLLGPNVHQILLLIKFVRVKLQEVEEKICGRPLSLVQRLGLSIPLHFLVSLHEVDSCFGAHLFLVSVYIDLQWCLLLTAAIVWIIAHSLQVYDHF